MYGENGSGVLGSGGRTGKSGLSGKPTDSDYSGYPGKIRAYPGKPAMQKRRGYRREDRLVTKAIAGVFQPRRSYMTLLLLPDWKVRPIESPAHRENPADRESPADPPTAF
jgi:hypothetical protein